jgi:hypothetical protein
MKYTKPTVLGSVEARVAIQSMNQNPLTKGHQIVDDAAPARSTTAAYEADE